MLPYAFMLLVPLLVGLIQSTQRREHRPAFWIYFLFLLLFCGLRYEIGPDWIGYSYIYEYYASTPIDQALHLAEPGYFLLNKFSDLLGLDLQGVVFFGSLIFLFGIFSYAKSTVSPWLAIASVMPYLVFVISLSGIRQACAIGIGHFMFSRWSRSMLLEKAVLIGLAVSFHNSAAILLLFIVVGLNRNILVRGLLAAAVFGAVAFGVDTSVSVERYGRVYLEENLVSGGAFFHVLLIAFPSTVYLIFRKKIAAASLLDSNVTLAAILTICSIPLLAVSSTGVDRLTLYFSFVQMWVYPAILRAKVVDPSLIRFGFSALIVGVFTVYFFFGTHAYTYIPYKNFLMIQTYHDK